MAPLSCISSTDGHLIAFLSSGILFLNVWGLEMSRPFYQRFGPASSSVRPVRVSSMLHAAVSTARARMSRLLLILNSRRHAGAACPALAPLAIKRRSRH